MKDLNYQIIEEIVDDGFNPNRGKDGMDIYHVNAYLNDVCLTNNPNFIEMIAGKKAYKLISREIDVNQNAIESFVSGETSGLYGTKTRRELKEEDYSALENVCKAIKVLENSKQLKKYMQAENKAKVKGNKFVQAYKKLQAVKEFLVEEHNKAPRKFEQENQEETTEEIVLPDSLEVEMQLEEEKEI